MKLNARLFGFLSLLFVGAAQSGTYQVNQNFWAGKTAHLINAPETMEQGLLPFVYGYYIFSEGGKAEKFIRYGGSQLDYQVENDNSISVSGFELYRSFGNYRSGFLPRAEAWWGTEVALEIIRMEDTPGCGTSGQLEFLQGLTSEFIQVGQAVSGGFQTEVTQIHRRVLVLPEYWLSPECGWRYDESPTSDETIEIDDLHIITDPENSFSDLSESDIIGKWALPVRYEFEGVDGDVNLESVNYRSDQFVFSQEQAVGVNSGLIFNWSLENGVLVFENDMHRYEYTMYSAVGNFYAITAKHTQDDYFRIYSSVAAKFSSETITEETLLSFLRQDYPMAIGSTLNKRKKDDFINGTTRCPDPGFFGFGFLTDGSVTWWSSCWQREEFDQAIGEYEFIPEYLWLKPHESVSYSYDAIMQTLEVVKRTSRT